MFYTDAQASVTFTSVSGDSYFLKIVPNLSLPISTCFFSHQKVTLISLLVEYEAGSTCCFSR